MPLYIKDDTVAALAGQAQAALGARSKTEAVRVALERVIKEAKAGRDVDERLAAAYALAARFRAEADPAYDHKADMDAGWGE